MRIADADARLVHLELKRKIKHAGKTRHATDNIIVTVTLEDGTVGYGEGVPRENVTGESAESAIELLKRSTLTQQLDADCSDFLQAVRLAERLHLAPIPGDDRLCGGNAARCALELAILDAYGRCYGEPLMNVTKVIAPELYEPHDRVRYSGAIFSAKGWKARVMAWSMRLWGFHQVKVKVGIKEQDDARRLRSIRRRVGATMDLRVDANEGWDASEAAERIRELEPFGITCVEQPIRHEQVAELSRIRKEVATPIMLDESLCGEVDAERAVRGQWCDLFNIRLSKCGGFIPSLKLAAFAARHGLEYQLGCHPGETAILSAAGRHFACSVKNLRYLEGSYDRFLFRPAFRLDDTGITCGWKGWAPMLAGSGLDVSIIPAKLNAVTVRKERLLG